MPKLKLFLYQIYLVLIITGLAALALWEYRTNNQFEAIFFPLFDLIIFWQTIKSWKKPNWGRAVNIAVWLAFFCCFQLPRIQKTYQNRLRFEKYGPLLNAKRSKLGIPIIPLDWQANYYDKRDAEWGKQDSTAGHQKKLVFLDSLGRLEFEQDTYYLGPSHSVKRYVHIGTYCSKSGSVDSAFYTYHTGMKYRVLSPAQADSLFKLEKIQKDY